LESTRIVSVVPTVTGSVSFWEYCTTCEIQRDEPESPGM
jgi:hypothetical protein